MSISRRKEEWAPIPGYEGHYLVSSWGNVKSQKKHIVYKKRGVPICRQWPEKILTLNDVEGYKVVTLSKDSRIKRLCVHRLVALVFCPNDNPVKKTIVNHKDENPSNNYFENLEWCTYSYNNKYGNRIKKIQYSLGKVIEQFTLDGIFVAYHMGCGLAEIATGIKANNIWQCCKGITKTAGGYIWKYSSKTKEEIFQ